MFSKVQKNYRKLLKWSSLISTTIRNPDKSLYCMSYYNYKYVENIKTKINFLETEKRMNDAIRKGT